MESVRHLIIGAGISGLATAAFSRDKDLLVLERDPEIGGYCKTVEEDGFTWDYSGHFFHFKHADIEAWLRERMPGPVVRTIRERASSTTRARSSTSPSRRTSTSSPRTSSSTACTTSTSRAPRSRARPRRASRRCSTRASAAASPRSSSSPTTRSSTPAISPRWTGTRWGASSPTPISTDIVRNMKAPDNASYNATFTYPEGGAIEYVKALASEVPRRARLARRAGGADRSRGGAWPRPRKREIRYERLDLLGAASPRCQRWRALAHDTRALHLEQGARLQPRLRPEGRERPPLGVLPGPSDVLLPHRLLRQHLRRRPDEPLRRARLPGDAALDAEEIARLQARVLADLRATGWSAGTSSSPRTRW